MRKVIYSIVIGTFLLFCTCLAACEKTTIEMQDVFPVEPQEEHVVLPASADAELANFGQPWDSNVADNTSGVIKTEYYDDIVVVTVEEEWSFIVEDLNLETAEARPNDDGTVSYAMSAGDYEVFRNSLQSVTIADDFGGDVS